MAFRWLMVAIKTYTPPTSVRHWMPMTCQPTKNPTEAQPSAQLKCLLGIVPLWLGDVASREIYYLILCLARAGFEPTTSSTVVQHLTVVPTKQAIIFNSLFLPCVSYFALKIQVLNFKLMGSGYIWLSLVCKICECSGKWYFSPNVLCLG